MTERLTDRLRLVPIGPDHAGDLWELHQEPGVAEWHAGVWSRDDAEQHARAFDHGWKLNGVHKWIAYDRDTGALVGRGGLSRAVVDGRERLEVGWTIREKLWGQGYATEIGRAALGFAFDDLDADEVVSCTERTNERSIAVMQRLGMHYIHDFPHNDEPFVLYVMRRSEYDQSASREP